MKPGKTLFIHCLIGIAMLFTMCRSSNDKQSIDAQGDQMIIEPLSNSQQYLDRHPGFAQVFEFLQRPDLADLDTGRYELDGDRIFCMVAKDQARPKNEASLEAHKKYIDIQYVIAGNEIMGWKPTQTCTSVKTPYDEEKDIMFFNDAPDAWNSVPPGSFTIFFPADAHAPLVGNGEIHKVVAKIAVE